MILPLRKVAHCSASFQTLHIYRSVLRNIIKKNFHLWTFASVSDKGTKSIENIFFCPIKIFRMKSFKQQWTLFKCKTFEQVFIYFSVSSFIIIFSFYVCNTLHWYKKIQQFCSGNRTSGDLFHPFFLIFKFSDTSGIFKLNF